MRGANKKNKRNKGIVLSLNSFLGDTPVGTVTVVKKISKIDDEDYSDEDGGNKTAIVLQLPTAPKAKRIYDDDTIPHKPPYMARISNLPFDANEEDVYELFGDFKLISVNLPREDGETGRLRGFGKIELEQRDDLINILSLPEPTIRGRRIRIELFNQAENFDNKFGAGNNQRRQYNNFGDSNANRESTNWRQDSRVSTAASKWSRNNETNNRETGTWRRNSPENSNNGASTWRRNSPDNLSNGASTWRQEKTGGTHEAAGSWRTGSRPKSGDFSTWKDNRDGNRRQNYGRNDNSPSREHGKWQPRNTREEQSSSAAINDSERPRLNLLPRQLPLPVIVNTAEAKAPTALNAGSNPELEDSGLSAETNTDSGRDSE